MNLLMKLNKYIDDGNHQKALEIALPLAINGDSDIQNFVGMYYFSNTDNKENGKEAERWLLASVAQGNCYAAQNLSALYVSNIDGVPYSIEKSDYWRMKAKDLGFNHEK